MTCVCPLAVSKSSDVEERERYRHQWRKEDRERVLSDRLELLVAVATGLAVGLWPMTLEGVVRGGFTGALIWFLTVLVRNRWSP